LANTRSDLACILLDSIAGNRAFISYWLVTSPLAGRQVVESMPHQHFVNRRHRKPHRMQTLQLIPYPLHPSRRSRRMPTIMVPASHQFSTPENDAGGFARGGQLHLPARIDAATCEESAEGRRSGDILHPRRRDRDTPRSSCVAGAPRDPQRN
jgi:hypothetical protein